LGLKPSFSRNSTGIKTRPLSDIANEVMLSAPN
jgi:hypothetical protein